MLFSECYVKFQRLKFLKKNIIVSDYNHFKKFINCK